MKLNKFELERLPLAEMNAIKAGSGESACIQGLTKCVGTDHDNNAGDYD